MTFVSPERFNKKTPTCSAVIAAGGQSLRMNGEDKLFVDICGVPALAHTLAAFQGSKYISEIIIVTREDSILRVIECCELYKIDKMQAVIAGGATRLQSTLNGVYAVSDKKTLIAIHDGARPCVTQTIIEKAVLAAAKYHAAAPGIQISSTVKSAKNRFITATVDRDSLYEIQTPQVFRAEIIKAALTNAIKKSIEVTDDCMAVELLGMHVYITEGSAYNIKLTKAEDILLVESILRKFGTLI